MGTFTIWFNDQKKQGLKFLGINAEDAAAFDHALAAGTPFTVVESTGNVTRLHRTITDISHTTWEPAPDA